MVAKELPPTEGLLQIEIKQDIKPTNDIMKNFYTVAGTILVASIIVLLASIIGGTIIWATWDMIDIFIGDTFLPENPIWWDCVKVSWLLTTISRIFLPTVEIKKV